MPLDEILKLGAASSFFNLKSATASGGAVSIEKIMKQVIKRSLIKLVIAIILCSTLGIIITSFAPHLTNDLALGQLENDDMSWSIFQTWYQVQNFVGVINFVIVLCFTYSIGKDILNYIERKKDE